MSDQTIQTAESTALAKFVQPVEAEMFALTNGGASIQIRSDVQYERVGLVLRKIREGRKALALYFKEAPQDLAAPRPGEGLCYFARRTWEAANSLFNKFDSRFQGWDQTADSALKRYRADVEAKAKAEAEARAAEERKRLEAEAAKQRAEAEKERKRLETIAEVERKKAEAERQARLAADRAAAVSERARKEAERRAEEERLRITREAEEAKRKAEEGAAVMRAEALAKEQEAASVVPIPEREVPKVNGISVHKVWKACPANASKDVWEGMTPAQRDKLCERMNWLALIKAVAQLEVPPLCLKPDWSKLSDLADTWGGQNPPPNIRFYQVEVTAARKVR